MIRIADTALEDRGRGWSRSANLLTLKLMPAAGWSTDETEFHHQLEIAAGRFQNAAPAGRIRIFEAAERSRSCRIALTKSDGK